MTRIDPGVAAEIAELSAGRRSRVLSRIAIAVLGVVGLALVTIWLVTPLRDWIDVTHLVDFMKRFGDSPLAPMVLLLAYPFGGLVAFPVNVLISVSVLMFGPLLGSAYALLGSLLSAALLYEIGRRLRVERLHRNLGEPMQRLTARLARRGWLAVMLVRIVPLAPYSVINVLAGAARIRRRDYFMGTALGMLPGIAVNALFVDRLVAVIEAPSPLTYALLAMAVAVIVALMVVLRRRVARAGTAE